MGKDTKIEWRRKSDGYRVTMTDAERQGCLDPDDYERLADYTAGQFKAVADAAKAKPAKDAAPTEE